MKRLSILTAIILAAAALMASFQNCYACTGITLKAKDGSTVVARTIEWAASDNDCRWVVVPRGHTWKSFIPGGGTGRSFTNEYGYVGVAVVQDELMMEGMNEKGLSAGLFYFPDYGKYEEYSEPNPDTAATKAFPYTADYKTAENGAIVNNAIFPLAFDALWSWSASTGWRASGYKNADYTTEATLYTEKIDLKNAEKPILVFDHIVRDFAGIELAKEQTSLWVRKDGGSWNQIAITFSYPDELGSEVMTSEEIKLDSYIGSVIQIAFKYVSDESKKAGTWQILKVEVKKSEEPTQPDNSSGTEDYDKPGWDWNK